MRRSVLRLAFVAATLPAFADGPVWTFGVDEAGRFGVVAAEADGVASVEVPSEWSGEPVLAVGAGAFAGCAGLEEVVVPASVEWIDPLAFEGCPALERIVVEDGSADYSSSDGVLFDGTGTFLLDCPEGRAGDYVVPAGTVEIDAEAFAGCASLASVAIPAGVERVGADAFAGCTSLSVLWVPSGASYDPSALGAGAACRIVRFEPGALDDPTLPPRWAVRFDANGGAGTTAEQVFERGTAAALRANAFSRKGHRFAGWARSAGGAVAFGDRQTVKDLAAAGERTTLYAQWTANRYKVRFDANGGTGTMADETFVWGTAKKLRRNAFARKGYEFLGWSKTKGGAVAYTDGGSAKNLVAENGGTVTLYAVWRGVVYYVAFHENDAAPAGAVQKFRYGKGKALKANPFPGPGLTFLGWAKKPGGAIVFGDRQVVRNRTSVAGRTVHLYARWAVTRYSVRFDPNGGTGTMADQRFRWGTAKRLRANSFKRKGFTFLGWAKKPRGAAAYADRASVVDLVKDGGPVVLYARWRRNRYKVRFDPNGGTGAMADEPFAWGRKKALSANSFERAGWVFLGWSKTATGEVAFADGGMVSDLSSKDGAVVVLHARWACENYKVRFEANGGTGTMADEAFVWGETRRLRANAFVRTGYRFLGWSKKASATKPSWKDRAAVRDLTADGGTVRLHAVWIEENDQDRILCLGDSITEGYACAGLPYPARLARLTGREVVNRGVGGTTSADGLRTAEENILSAHAATVCILFGANDAIHHVSAATTKENLRKIVRLCRENGCTPVLGTPPHQSGEHAQFDDGAAAVAKAVRDLAREEGVALADVRSAFGGNDRYLNPDDGLHLSDAGGDLLARLFRDAL